MIIHNVEQNSKEWDALRLGKPTASNFKKIITSGGIRSKSLEEYAYKLVDDIYGFSKPSFKSWEMERGHECEEIARGDYNFINDLEMVQVGCISHDTIMTVVSPDGLIGNDGMWECKSRLLHIMKKDIAYIEKNKRVPTGDYAQCQGQLWVAERDWVDYTIYHPKGSYTFRQHRDEEFIKALEILVKEACAIVKSEVEESIYQQKFGNYAA